MTPAQLNQLLGALGQLTNSVQLLNVPMAQLHIPTAQLAPAMAKLVPQPSLLSGLFAGLGGQVGSAAGAIGGFITKMHPAAAAVAIAGLAFQKVGQTVAQAGQMVAKFFSADLPSALAVLPVKLAAQIPIVGKAFEGLENAITSVTGAIGSLVSWLNPEMWRAVSITLELAMLPAVRALIPILQVTQLYFAKIGMALESLTPSFEKLAMQIVPPLSAWLDVMVGVLRVSVQHLVTFGGMAAQVATAFIPVMDMAVGFLAQFADGLHAITPVLAEVFGIHLAIAVDLVKESFFALTDMTDVVVNVFIRVHNALVSMIAAIGEVVENLPGLGDFGAAMKAAAGLHLGLVNTREAFADMAERGRRLREGMDREAEWRRRLANTAMSPRGGLSSLESFMQKMQSKSLEDSPAEREKQKLQTMQQIVMKLGLAVDLIHNQGAR